ncbi:MAG: fructose-1,6-bisphosphatase [Intestinibacillus sp.]
MRDQHYLKLLAEKYPTEQLVEQELVKMTAALSLPKGTEYFFSDLHGEHEAFIHLLRSASGVIRDKIEIVFGQSLLESDRAELASLIYYAEQQLIYKKKTCPRYYEWCEITLNRLVKVCREVSAKYSREKVRKTMDEEWASILEELLYVDEDIDTLRYHRSMISACIEAGAADQVIISLCALIRQISIDHLHIIGDIFDRGPRADRIMDELMKYHDVDIQWGNHDVSWIGAVCGNRVCVANVLRIATRYNNFDLLEDGYGINLRPLSAFAVIQFKLEGQLVGKYPEFQMDDRKLLDKIDFVKQTVRVGAKTYPMRDCSFPTVDAQSPYTLTAEEEALMEQLAASFRHSTALKRHIEYLFSHGAMYKATNGNLLYHGCVPMLPDGAFDQWEFDGRQYSGKRLFDFMDSSIREAYFNGTARDIDLIWYWWCGAKSPLYGKSAMTAFERYFIADKSTYEELANPYYDLYDDPAVCRRILDEFGLQGDHVHIVNGHVPVRQGENPVKAQGMLYIIDGGISKAYQSKTGIGGYTLIYNSHYIALAEHQKFVPGDEDAVPSERYAKIRVVEMMPKRRTIAETDVGVVWQQRIEKLKQLLQSMRAGRI